MNRRKTLALAFKQVADIVCVSTCAAAWLVPVDFIPPSWEPVAVAAGLAGTIIAPFMSAALAAGSLLSSSTERQNLSAPVVGESGERAALRTEYNKSARGFVRAEVLSASCMMASGLAAGYFTLNIVPYVLDIILAQGRDMGWMILLPPVATGLALAGGFLGWRGRQYAKEITLQEHKIAQLDNKFQP